MNTCDTYFTNNVNSELAVSTFSTVATLGRENFCKTTIHVNPLCTSNKILVNKEKLSKGFRRNAVATTASSLSKTTTTATVTAKVERIYCNPKFLANRVKTCADTNNKSNIFNNFQNEIKKSDTNIHINRNYLNTQQNDAAAVLKQPSYVASNYQQYCGEQNRGIHINPKFLLMDNSKKKMGMTCQVAAAMVTQQQSSTPSSCSSFKSSALIKNKQSHPSNKINRINKSGINSKYKFVKNFTNQSVSKNQNSSSAVCYKTKYTLKRLTNAGKNKLFETQKCKTPISLKAKLVRLSSEFKKFSRTKLVRKSVLQSMILARRRSRINLLKITDKKFPSSVRKKTKNLTYFPKGNSNSNSSQVVKINGCSPINHSFKRLSKMKIVRKSLLKAQIEARKQVKKVYLKNQRLLNSTTKTFLKNYSLRRKSAIKQRALLKWRKKKSAESTALKSKKTGILTPSSKNLKKNNQPCPFYNRFGRCKGKDRGTCPKLHDAKYISICRKLLQGDCNAKDCLLSHDIRPGKMPTCHHYLAGLCTRPNCPFLHIKVNPKAPICLAFLQGFCPDVFNCLKRHEFICPIFAEKGNCPKGKSCAYPHRSPVVHSKLLKDDQKPLIARKDIISEGDVYCEHRNMSEVSTLACNPSTFTSCSLECQHKNNNNLENIVPIKNMQIVKKRKKEYVKETFTRYFAIPSDETEKTGENNDANPITSPHIENNNDQPLR